MKKALSVVTILLAILFLFITLVPKAQAGSKEITLEWQKTTIEKDLAGFTIYEYIHIVDTDNTDDISPIPVLSREIDIAYVEGAKFVYSGTISLAGGEEYIVYYDIDAYDKSNNHSDKSDRVSVGVDYKAPEGCTGFKAILKIIME